MSDRYHTAVMLQSKGLKAVGKSRHAINIHSCLILSDYFII